VDATGVKVFFPDRAESGFFGCFSYSGCLGLCRALLAPPGRAVSSVSCASGGGGLHFEQVLLVLAYTRVLVLFFLGGVDAHRQSGLCSALPDRVRLI